MNFINETNDDKEQIVDENGVNEMLEYYNDQCQEDQQNELNLIELYFQEGPLGITLRRRNGDGVVFVYEIIPESQAVDLDIKPGDELWGVGDIEIGETPLDKKAWDGLIQHIKKSSRPLKITWRRHANYVHEAPKQNVPYNNNNLEAEETLSPSFKELKQLLSRMHLKDEKSTFIPTLPGQPRKSSHLVNDFNSLLKEGRQVLKIGNLFVSSKIALWNTHAKRTLVLLSDLLIISTPQPSNKLQVDYIIDLQTCKLRSDGQVFGGGDPSTSSHAMSQSNIELNKDLMFQIIFPGASIEVYADSKETKEVWVLRIYLAICENVSDSERVLGWRHQYMLGTMHAAVLGRDEQRVKELITLCENEQMEFTSIDSIDEDGYTPLHYACILRIHNIIRILHEAPADVTIRDLRGFTPLHWAALLLDECTLTLLSSHVFDTDLLDNFNRTPLELACIEGRDMSGKSNPNLLKKCVACLLEHRSEVQMQDDCGRNLVHYLASSWQYDAMQLLIDAGINPQAVDLTPRKMTALHYAAQARSLKYAVSEGMILLNKFGLTNAGAADGSMELVDPPLPTVSEVENQTVKIALPRVEYRTGESEEIDNPCGVDTLRCLLQSGARPNFRDGSGKSALMIMMESDLMENGPWGDDFPDAVGVLLSYGARLDDPSYLPLLNARFPEMNFTAFIEKWNAIGLVNGDALEIKLNQFESPLSVLIAEHSDKVNSISSVSSLPANSQSSSAPATPVCTLCSFQFTMFRRQHHCRLCNALCCDECSKKRCMVENEKVRTCDSCFNRVIRMGDLQTQKAMIESFKPMPATNSSEIVSTSLPNPSAKSSVAPSDARRELFGSAASVRITSSINRDSQKPSAHSTVSQTMGVMNETTERLHERGEKLSRLGDRTADMANQASEFARLAKQLNEQQKSRCVTRSSTISRKSSSILRAISDVNSDDSSDDSRTSVDSEEFENYLKSNPVWQNALKNQEKMNGNPNWEALRKSQSEKAEEIYRVYPFNNVSLPTLFDCNNYFSGMFGEYFWHQNSDQVYVFIPIDDNVEKSSIKVEFEAKSVRVFINNEEIIFLQCLERIIPDGSFWVIENDSQGKRYIQLDLEKRLRMINWKSLFGEPNEKGKAMVDEENQKLLDNLYAANRGMSKLTGVPAENFDDMANDVDIVKMMSNKIYGDPEAFDEDGNILDEDKLGFKPPRIDPFLDDNNIVDGEIVDNSSSEKSDS